MSNLVNGITNTFENLEKSFSNSNPLYKVTGPFKDILNGVHGVEEKFLGPTYPYYKNINTPSESSSNATTFYPDVAYFIKDRLAVGLTIQFLNQTNKNAANDKDVTTIMGLAPTVQYYVPISNRFMFMGGLQVAYKVRKDKRIQFRFIFFAISDF